VVEHEIDNSTAAGPTAPSTDQAHLLTDGRDLWELNATQPIDPTLT
jgi:hypothetical protein